MYLEHEELLVMSNTLEQERDLAQKEAWTLASRLRAVRQVILMEQVESDLLPHTLKQDLVIQYCDDIIRRYTPQ